MKLLCNILQGQLRLAWHHGCVFFQSIRSLVPIAAWLTVLMMVYDDKPLNLAQTYMAVAPWFFIIMVWFGYLFLSGLDQTSEHILILQINSRKLYATSKILFLLVICIALSLLTCLYPIILNIVFQLREITFFTYEPRLSDFFGSLFLHIILGILGMSVSLLFQPDLTKRRDEISLIMLILFAISSYAKNQLVDVHELFRYFLWIFPPVYDIARLFIEKGTFMLYDLALIAVYGLLYSVTAVAVGQWIYSRRLYGPHIAVTEKQNR